LATWKSVDDLVQDLGLFVSPGDFEAIEKILKQQLHAVHPDTTNGDFKSDSQREQFYRISQALEFIQGQRSGPPALRSADIPAIVEATLLALRQAAPQPTHTRLQVMDNVRRELRRLDRLPKITSATLFAICTTLFTFIGSVSEHPLLKGLVQYPAVSWLFAIVWAVSGISFIMVWLRERVTEQAIQNRLSERALQEAFQDISWYASQNPERRFSRSDLVERQLDSDLIDPFWLRRQGHKVRLSQWLRWFRERFILRPKIDRHAAEEIVTFYLSRLSERGAIKRSSYADTTEWFEVDASVLERYR
jgi:hypothetical protein